MHRPQDQLVLGAEFAPGQTIRFRYRNWQGSTTIRTAQVIRITFGSTEWHQEPQWLLEARDLDKNVLRVFALHDMSPIN